MKKKILALVLTSILCLSLAIPCFAASKPAIEITRTHFNTNSVGGVSPSIYFCNNSSKTIKYITWYMTPYNAVGDAVRCTVSNRSQVQGRTTGPIAPLEIKIDEWHKLGTKYNASEDDPFATSRFTDYSINTVMVDNGPAFSSVYADQYGNYFVTKYNTATKKDEGVYLTENEIQTAMSDYHLAAFDCAWYNGSIRNFKVNKAVVEFMDGSGQTISGNQLYGEKYNHVLEEKPFLATVNQYVAVYNYKDYMQYNPDLVAVFSNNQKALFKHFVNSGMKEGRQASSQFNLAAYKANNPDLVALFGDDNVKYYEHYMTGGKAEGRIAT